MAVNGTEVESLSERLLTTDDRIRFENIRKSLQCMICSKTFAEPVTLHCGHIFCSSCLHAKLYKKNECPRCRALAQPKDITKSLFTEGVLFAFANIESTFLASCEIADSAEGREVHKSDIPVTTSSSSSNSSSNNSSSSSSSSSSADGLNSSRIDSNRRECTNTNTCCDDIVQSQPVLDVVPDTYANDDFDFDVSEGEVHLDIQEMVADSMPDINDCQMLLPPEDTIDTSMVRPPSRTTSSNNSTCTEVDETIIDSQGCQDDTGGAHGMVEEEGPEGAVNPAGTTDPTCDGAGDEEDWVEVYCSQPCYNSQTSLLARREGHVFPSSSSLLRKRKHEGTAVGVAGEEEGDDEEGAGGDEGVAMDEAEGAGGDLAQVNVDNDEPDDVSKRKPPELLQSPVSVKSDSNGDSQFDSVPSDDSLGPHTCSYFYEKINEAIPDIDKAIASMEGYDD